MKKMLNIKYSFMQVLFYASMSCMMGFASVYLLSKDFSNTLIGTTLSLSSIILVFTQMTVASFSDNHPEIKLQTLINYILGICLLSSTALYFFDNEKMIILVLFVLTVVALQTAMPLLNSLAFIFESKGIIVNYGLARGLGSGAYAIVSMMMGYFIIASDVKYLPIIYIIFIVLLIIVVQKYGQSLQRDVTKKIGDQKDESIIQFVKKYKNFFLFILGSMCVYIAHVFINNFFIQIITSIGGNESDMGNAIFLGSIVEVPMMLLFPILLKKISCQKLLKISFVIFLLKHLLTYFSTNISFIYFAQILQMGSNALYATAGIYYANDVIEDKDRMKGQTMITLVFCSSGIISNIIGGILLDTFNIKTILLMSVLITLLGAVLAITNVECKKSKSINLERID